MERFASGTNRIGSKRLFSVSVLARETAGRGRLLGFAEEASEPVLSLLRSSGMPLLSLRESLRVLMRSIAVNGISPMDMSSTQGTITGCGSGAMGPNPRFASMGRDRASQGIGQDDH